MWAADTLTEHHITKPPGPWTCGSWTSPPYAASSAEGQRRVVGQVKINFLAGRVFVDDADLQMQCTEWQERTNTTRPSQATDVTPLARLVAEVAKGYLLPSTATDFGFVQPGQVSSGALVAVLGNSYSVVGRQNLGRAQAARS